MYVTFVYIVFCSMKKPLLTIREGLAEKSTLRIMQQHSLKLFVGKRLATAYVLKVYIDIILAFSWSSFILAPNRVLTAYQNAAAYDQISSPSLL